MTFLSSRFIFSGSILLVVLKGWLAWQSGMYSSAFFMSDHDGRVFRESFFFCDIFMDVVLFTTFYWCKTEHSFTHFSLAYLVSSWKCLL